MSLRRYLAATVIITLFFGLSLLLAPAQLASLYNLDLSPAGQFIAGFGYYWRRISPNTPSEREGATV